jgi:hypothetical protein
MRNLLQELQELQIVTPNSWRRGNLYYEIAEMLGIAKTTANEIRDTKIDNYIKNYLGIYIKEHK